eukprot:2286006-Pyramimonas_sp.AAC.1
MGENRGEPIPRVFAGQETRIRSRVETGMHQKVLRGKGLDIGFCHAVCTGEHALATSAGVLEGARRYLNQNTIEALDLAKVSQAAGRVLARNVHDVLPGGIVWVSVYVYHSIGVTAQNAELLAGLG